MPSLLSREETDALSATVAEWTVDADYTAISRRFRFKDFCHTMAFVNAVAWIAHQTDHHPDMEVSYGHCLVRFTTRAVGGLSARDFACAAQVDTLSAD